MLKRCIDNSEAFHLLWLTDYQDELDGPASRNPGMPSLAAEAESRPCSPCSSPSVFQLEHGPRRERSQRGARSSRL
jgi:hypothetical protein